MLPRWIYPVIIIWFIIGIGAFAFTWSKCGANTLILGNGGFAAAASGICDK
jgi:hypothetical protein